MQTKVESKALCFLLLKKSNLALCSSSYLVIICSFINYIQINQWLEMTKIFNLMVFSRQVSFVQNTLYQAGTLLILSFYKIIPYQLFYAPSLFLVHIYITQHANYNKRYLPCEHENLVNSPVDHYLPPPLDLCVCCQLRNVIHECVSRDQIRQFVKFQVTRYV